MAWNTGKSILGTGDTRGDVEREADVILTAAFLGMTLFQNEKKQGLAWRVDIDVNTDLGKNRDGRTSDDRKYMKALNDVCSKVNQVVRTQLDKDVGGVSWGLTPTFGRGGMICAGKGAEDEYEKVNPAYARTAYSYLTASQQASEDNQRAEEMYIGRGAYCGLVVDDDGNAVSAMSTICTALNPDTPGVGDRWKPAADADVRIAQYPNDRENATWGIIGSVALQATLRQQGMRFFPQDAGVPVPLNKDKDIAGYTHGMIRCIYETVRIGQGTAFEMAIGTNTFKLASCLSCSSFMMANGVDASSSHLGRGESWVPYYSGESHNPSYFADGLKGGLNAAIDLCNRRYAEFMHQCLRDGVAAMKKSLTWVEKKHQPALDALDKKLQTSEKSNTVARDLYLDAMTFHKSDAERLNDTLVYGDNARRFCNGTYDWCQNRQTANDTKGTWETWVNPLTDEEVKALHTAPDSLVNKYKIRVWSPHKDDSCALAYSLLNAEGKEAQKGTLSQGANETHGPVEISVGSAEFSVAASGNVETWKIKIGSDRDYAKIKLNQSTALGSGDRYSYEITKG